jgi:hypothetical protein
MAPDWKKQLPCMSFEGMSTRWQVISFLMIHFRVLAMTIALLMNHPLQIQPQRPSPWRFDGRIFPCIIFSSWSYNPLHLIFVCEPCSNPILLIIVVSPS